MKRSLNPNDTADYGVTKRLLHINDAEDEENTENKNTEAAKNFENYVDELISEKSEVEKLNLKHSVRFLEEEILKVKSTGRIPREFKYVNVYKEKPIKVIVKVLVPIQDHPKFNFVGKLLGPKGNTLKRLQEETMCRMSVLGKGSMKNPQREEELKALKDPKYAHLSEELHVEICAFGPPSVAHSKMSYALAEIKKYLIPDKNDAIRQEQLRELESLTGSGTGPTKGFHRNPGYHSKFPVPDKGRPSMEERYGYNEPGAHVRSHGYDAPSSPAYRYDKFEDTRFASTMNHRAPISPSYGDPSSQRWKPSGVSASRHPDQSRFRSTSYQTKDSYWKNL